MEDRAATYNFSCVVDCLGQMHRKSLIAATEEDLALLENRPSHQGVIDRSKDGAIAIS